jgi:hypothetical protein
MPERSVTRFFIPLIDVLILLFCIYLLMPLAEGTEGKGDPSHPAAVAEQGRITREELAKLKEQAAAAARQLDDLRREKSDLLAQRLAIKVLEIDPGNGKLYCFDRGERIDIQSVDHARQLIDRHRHDAGSRQLYYLFLFPRQDTGYPEQRQFSQYERWFAQVLHGLDNPRGRPR